MIPLSVLDLAPIAEGITAGNALNNARDLARHGENLGYKRFWMAEHHSMPGIASAATAVALCHVAGGTSTIRVGAGGIMLPNHSPLQVAEQFGTLEALFPGRIDLGLGRAPGTDQAAAYAHAAQPIIRCRPIPARCRRAHGLFQTGRRGPTGARGSWRGHGHSGLDPGVEPVRRRTRRQPGSALRVRLALRAATDDGRAPLLPHKLRCVRTARQALRHARLQRVRGRQRRGGAAARDLAPAGVRCAADRTAGQAPATRRRLCRYAAPRHALLGGLLSCSAIGSPASVKAADRVVRGQNRARTN